MIKFKCDHCGKDNITAPDEYAGRKGRCPQCKQVLTIPRKEEEVFDDFEVVEEKPAPAARKPAPRPAPAAAPAKRKPAEDDDLVSADDVIEDEAPARKPAARAKANTSIRPTKPAPARRAPARDEDDEDDVEEVAEAVEADEVEDDDEDERRPKKKKKKKRRRGPRGPYADCPNCGEPGNATKVVYTLWGGFIGPMMFNHVRCDRCGTAYNGTTGNYNTVAIILFVVVPSILGFGICILSWSLRLFSGGLD